MMKRIACAMMLLAVLGACKGKGQGQDARVPAQEGTETVEETVFTPVFTAEEIPAAVQERMIGVSYPREGALIQLSELRYLRLAYVDFDGNPQVGEMICNAAIAQDVLEIFQALFEARYPICSIRLIDEFGGNDEASMRADNSSSFNYRVVSGTTSLSNHAKGLAVDINPLENPYINRKGEVEPATAGAYVDRTQDFPHKIDENDLCYKLFVERGFTWGGTWQSVKDYQHFEKPQA